MLLLPGRGVPAHIMLKVAHHMGLTKHLRIALEPKHKMWYPMPNGANDQELAVQGLRYANTAVNSVINIIQKGWRLTKGDIALLGFSAGSVVALDVATKSDEPFACCVSMSGTILEPQRVPEAANNTPIILQHNLHDNVFSWDERYVPTRDALRQRGYQLTLLERQEGDHNIYREDITNISKLIRRSFGERRVVAQQGE